MEPFNSSLVNFSKSTLGKTVLGLLEILSETHIKSFVFSETTSPSDAVNQHEERVTTAKTMLKNATNFLNILSPLKSQEDCFNNRLTFYAVP